MGTHLQTTAPTAYERHIEARMGNQSEFSIPDLAEVLGIDACMVEILRQSGRFGDGNTMNKGAGQRARWFVLREGVQHFVRNRVE
jgi:hypothetical protein